MRCYLVPAHEQRAELKVANSRFIATLVPVFSVSEARAFISRIRSEFADASHNVPAYIIGFGTSAISHCSDDGEPHGTAGRPCLTVLQGSGMGDIAVVVTRYFGGTKLGIGGLVRAYTEAVKQVVGAVPRAERVPMHTATLESPYPLFERVHKLILNYRGEIINQDFKTNVTITVRFTINDFPKFDQDLQALSHGTVRATLVDTQDTFRLIKEVPN